MSPRGCGPERLPDLCDHLKKSLRILLEIVRMNSCNVKIEQIKKKSSNDKTLK